MESYLKNNINLTVSGDEKKKNINVLLDFSPRYNMIPTLLYTSTGVRV